MVACVSSRARALGFQWDCAFASTCGIRTRVRVVRVCVFVYMRVCVSACVRAFVRSWTH